MKKTPDVSKNVMDRVVRFEEDRSRHWYVKFSLILLGLVAVIFGGAVIVWNQFSQNQTFELFTLFYEDWEIISEYWKDTLEIIWEEAPQDVIFIGLSALIVVIAVVILSRRKRKILSNVRGQVAKYRKHL